jgi:hypothetical protein
MAGMAGMAYVALMEKNWLEGRSEHLHKCMEWNRLLLLWRMKEYKPGYLHLLVVGTSPFRDTLSRGKVDDTRAACLLVDATPPRPGIVWFVLGLIDRQVACCIYFPPTSSFGFNACLAFL